MALACLYTPSTPAHRYAYITLLVIYLVFWVSSSLLYFLRRNIDPIRSRGWVIPWLQGVYGVVHLSLMVAARTGAVPCVVVNFSIGLFLPVLVFVSRFILPVLFSSKCFHPLLSMPSHSS